MNIEEVHNKSEIVSLLSPAKKLNDQTIVIARLEKVTGLEGWIRMSILTDNPDRFVPGAAFSLKAEGSVNKALEIQAIKQHHLESKLNVRFEGYFDRDSASSLIGGFLVIPLQKRMAIDSEDRFYADELAGMKLLSEKGKPIGTVKSLEAENASPYISAVTDKGEILIPFRRVFIESIDRQNSTLKLAQPVSIHTPEN